MSQINAGSSICESTQKNDRKDVQMLMKKLPLGLQYEISKMIGTVFKFWLRISISKVRSSYGPLAYFSDIFISGKMLPFLLRDDNIFPEMKISEKYASGP